MPDINSDIQYLKGVGPAYAKKFARLGIYTIRDLLLHYPRRYIDYSQPYTVVSAPFDVDCCVKATVLQRDPDRRIKGGRMLSHVLAGDDTGMLALSWFNAPYAAEKLEPGTEYYFEGRVGGMMTRREILHPLVRTEAQVAAAPLLPVYGSTEGLPAARLTRCAQLALEYVAQLDDPLPPELLTHYRMPPKADAVRAIHAPRDAADAAAARRRLIFEELYILQLGIFLMRGHGRKITGAPMRELDLFLPPWVDALPAEHPIKSGLYAAIRASAGELRRVREVEGVLAALGQSEHISAAKVRTMDLGTGVASADIDLPRSLFYETLAAQSGFPVADDGDLMSLLTELSAVKREYDRVAPALREVRETGYGIVAPSIDELTLEEPEIVKQGGRYGVRLRASAPSIHMMAANITTEVSPIVGSEKQSEELVHYLLHEFEESPQKIWESNIFGTSLHELVNQGLHNKLYRMPSDARIKLQETVERIINEGCTGLICIIL